jgi:hypothetical protein
MHCSDKHGWCPCELWLCAHFICEIGWNEPEADCPLSAVFTDISDYNLMNCRVAVDTFVNIRVIGWSLGMSTWLSVNLWAGPNLNRPQTVAVSCFWAVNGWPCRGSCSGSSCPTGNLSSHWKIVCSIEHNFHKQFQVFHVSVFVFQSLKQKSIFTCCLIPTKGYTAPPPTSSKYYSPFQAVTSPTMHLQWFV